METTDVIVIGGGVVGASVAWHLARNHRVCVLEQSAAPGLEATSQNAGLIRRMSVEPSDRALARRTFAFLQSPPASWRGRVPAHTTGAVLALGHDPLHLHDAVAHLTAAGVQVCSVDHPARLTPLLAGSPLCGAWHLPDEMVLDGKALTDLFLEGGTDRTLDVHLGVRVIGLHRVAGRVVGVQTEDELFLADRVVIAGGAWCQDLADSAGLDRPLIPLRRHILHLQGPTFESPWVWVEDIGVYVRGDGDHWMACACDEALAPLPTGPDSAGPLSAAAAALVEAKVRTFFPTLSGAKVIGGWSGLRTFAPDRHPVLGPDPDLPGLWWAAGLGGGGVSGCVGVGEAIAAWMADEPTPWLDTAAVAPGRAMLSRWAIYPRGDLDSATLVNA